MNIRYCTNCVMPSTRPRISFNEQGVCNACQWAEEKRTKMDWQARWRELKELCDKYRSRDGSKWDIIVPCSGGKDGSYVAWILKHKMSMHPLCLTVAPEMPTEIGRQNLDNFIKSGFDHILITPDFKVRRRLNKRGFIRQGRPMLADTIAFTTITLRVAVQFNIPLVMRGEEGEAEYGGTMSQAYTSRRTRDHVVNVTFSGYDPLQYLNEFTKDELKWWMLPTEEEWQRVGLYLANWSYFEDWDPYKHYLLAKERCGLQGDKIRSGGTYTNFAQLDDDLYWLHTYLMYLKLGFGRCSQDVGIDIRRGALSREQGLILVKKYDEDFREELLPGYLEYFNMTRDEFEAVLDKWVNKELFEKVNGRWRLTFEPK